MTHVLHANETDLQQRAREFALSVVKPRGAEIDRVGEYPWNIADALAREGFMGMTIPEAYGGQGRSFLDVVLAIEEMAKFCTVTARIVVEANMGAVSAVMAYGSEKQKRLAADLVLAGDKPAICITEPDAGSDATAMSTRAQKRGNGYVLNGCKHWITGGGVSKLHLIFARTIDEDGRAPLFPISGPSNEAVLLIPSTIGRKVIVLDYEIGVVECLDKILRRPTLSTAPRL